MPPKVKVTREDILRAAVEIVRAEGAQALNARNIAAALHCSTQPVFSNFATMEELRLGVVDAADALYRSYQTREIEKGEVPPYKASGMAYIRFAKEEKELFKLLFMRDRSAEEIPEQTDETCRMERFVHKGTGLEGADARLFHLEMWAYVHGIATMMATGYLDLDWALVSRMLTDAFEGMRKRYTKE